MTIEKHVIKLAAIAHRKCWSDGCIVSEQTKKSQNACKAWQDFVLKKYGNRFTAEKSIGKGSGQRIDLVDEQDFMAYELKASGKNVHMEIYRDVFKTLVYNRRNRTSAIRKLIFIAPMAGIVKLGREFSFDVQAIASRLKLELILAPI